MDDYAKILVSHEQVETPECHRWGPLVPTARIVFV